MKEAKAEQGIERRRDVVSSWAEGRNRHGGCTYWCLGQPDQILFYATCLTDVANLYQNNMNQTRMGMVETDGNTSTPQTRIGASN